MYYYNLNHMSRTWTQDAETLLRSLLHYTVLGGLSYTKHKATWQEIADSMNEAGDSRSGKRYNIHRGLCVLYYIYTASLCLISPRGSGSWELGMILGRVSYKALEGRPVVERVNTTGKV
jgi:hypothetical protein